MTNDHLNIETLSVYADRELGGLDQARVERHLDGCAACRSALQRVRALVEAAAALPADLAPPPEVWQAIERAVVARPSGRSRASRLRVAGMAVAAGVVLAVGVTITRPGRSAKVPAASAPVATPAALAFVDRSYVGSIAELRDILQQQGPLLSPATVRVLEHSVALIDTAIAEARQALAADPANRVLAGILAAQYRQKVDLLQRAAKLSLST